MMQQWEYKTIDFKTKGVLGGLLDLRDFNDALNEYGENGWELVNCFDTNQSYGSSRTVVAVFKRPKQ